MIRTSMDAAMPRDRVPRLVRAAAVHEDGLQVHTRLREDRAEAALQRRTGVQVGTTRLKRVTAAGPVRRRRLSTK